MKKAFSIFEESFSRIEQIDSLLIHLTSELKFNPVDVSDLLRTQIVYALSAFDKLIHDLVRFGMLEIFDNQRAPTRRYLSFPITVEVYNELTHGNNNPEILFERHIQRSHKHLSFQYPDKVAEALSLFWNEEHKWQAIADSLGKDKEDLKVELKNIVLRRNQIVHESDIELSSGSLQNIHHNDTERSIKFMKDLGATIYELVKL